jgi:small basic protein
VDLSILQPVLIAVLSPVLLLTGVIYVLVTPKMALSALVLSALAAVFGGHDLYLVLSGPYHPTVTLTSLYFLVLAAIANIRWLSSRRVLRKARAPKMGVRIVSRNAWMLEKRPNDPIQFLLPKALVASHRDFAESDMKFRITCDIATEPIEGTFEVTYNRQILLPERVLNKLGSCRSIRFEILE